MSDINELLYGTLRFPSYSEKNIFNPQHCRRRGGEEDKKDGEQAGERKRERRRRSGVIEFKSIGKIRDCENIKGWTRTRQEKTNFELNWPRWIFFLPHCPSASNPSRVSRGRITDFSAK